MPPFYMALKGLRAKKIGRTKKLEIFLAHPQEEIVEDVHDELI
jgi:hypothetical protein